MSASKLLLQISFQTNVIVRSAFAPLDPVSVPDGIVILNRYPDFHEVGPSNGCGYGGSGTVLALSG